MVTLMQFVKGNYFANQIVTIYQDIT